MRQNSHIKCLECGTISTNSDHCTNCGAIINIAMKRKLERQKKMAQKRDYIKSKTSDKVDGFFTRGKNHKYAIVRFLSKALHSIWWLVMIIGGILAYIIGVIAL